MYGSVGRNSQLSHAFYPKSLVDHKWLFSWPPYLSHYHPHSTTIMPRNRPIFVLQPGIRSVLRGLELT